MASSLSQCYHLAMGTLHHPTNYLTEQRGYGNFDCSPPSDTNAIGMALELEVEIESFGGPEAHFLISSSEETSGPEKNFPSKPTLQAVGQRRRRKQKCAVKKTGRTRPPIKPSQRNAANARERCRMRVLSKAFTKLKTSLPWVPADTKLSKLDTLRLAACYIAHLQRVLENENENAAVPPVNLVSSSSYKFLLKNHLSFTL